MCLTVFEASGRDSEHFHKKNNLRGKASYQYNIEFDVLDILGELSTNKGDQTEARKAPKNGNFDPIKPEEREWIIKAIKILIRRAGEWAHDPDASLKIITLMDI
jgi:hypothetical protein